MRYMGQVESGPVWSEIEKVAARYPNVWTQIALAAQKYATTYGVQREFLNPSVISEKVYQWRYGIPPQGPVEEAIHDAVTVASKEILGNGGAPRENGTMILIAGAIGVALLAWTMRPRRGRRR